MSARGRRAVLGAMAFWPALFALCWVGFFLSSGRDPVLQKLGDVGLILALLFSFAGVVVTLIMILSLLAYYVWYMANDRRFTTWKTTLWIMALVLFSVAAMPLFFCLYVGRDPEGAV